MRALIFHLCGVPYSSFHRVRFSISLFLIVIGHLCRSVFFIVSRGILFGRVQRRLSFDDEMGTKDRLRTRVR